MPLPVDVLIDVSEQKSQRLFVASGSYGQGYQLPVVTQHTAVNMRWSDSARADWVLVIHDGSGAAKEMTETFQDQEPRWSGFRGGVHMTLWPQ